MSLLIELPESPQPHPHEHMLSFSRQVASLLQHSDLSGAAILSHQPTSITIGIPRGQCFMRGTHWRFEIKPESLKIVVSFLDVEGLAPLRAQSERMKLQLMILLRFINYHLSIEQEYFVEPHSGILRFIFRISWVDFTVKLGKVDPLRKLVQYLFTQLQHYAQIVSFCEPTPKEWQAVAPSGLQDLNRYRFLLRNTRKFRQVGVSHIRSILELKEQLKRRPNTSELKAQLDHVHYLFQENIHSYKMYLIGLERNQQTLKKLESCLKHISKNERGIESQAPTSNTVQGIIIQHKEDLKILSTQGSHSQILKGKFVYKQCATINLQTGVDLKVWSDGKELTGQLVVKQCVSDQQASLNSFENELIILSHLRDSKCSYMANYWLDLKYSHQRSAKDPIYMKPYPHNLYSIIKKCKTLSVIERISIAYRLAKGFCFLGSKAVLHRDFKPQNVMVDNFFNPYIIDFGSCAPVYKSKNFEVRQSRLLSTITYQIYYHTLKDDLAYIRSKFTRQQYNQHPLFDVYSFGCVLSQIFFLSIRPPAPESLELTPFSQFHRNVYFLIDLCSHADPDERPTFPEIVSFLGTLDCLTQAGPQISSKIRSTSAPSHSAI